MRRRSALAGGLAVLALVSACTSSGSHGSAPSGSRASASSAPTPAPSPTSATRTTTAPARAHLLPGMPAPLDPHDVYAADRPGQLSPVDAHDPAYVYVPDTNSDDVYVISQLTMRVVRVFAGGNEPQHVVPSYDLRTLYVTAD